MRKVLAVLAAVLCETIPLTILYEKNDSSSSRRLARVLVREALGNYNRVLHEVGIELVLARFADYTVYSKIAEFRGLARLAGGDSLEGRLAALKSTRGNVIVLVAAPNAEKAKGLGKVRPCGTRLLVDLSRGSAEAVAVFAVQQWLSKLIRRHVPDPFVENFGAAFTKDVRKARLQERVKRCRLVEAARDDSLEDAGFGNTSSGAGQDDPFSSTNGFSRGPEPTRASHGWQRSADSPRRTASSSGVQIDRPFRFAPEDSAARRLPKLGNASKVRRFKIPGSKT